MTSIQNAGKAYFSLLSLGKTCFHHWVTYSYEILMFVCLQNISRKNKAVMFPVSVQVLEILESPGISGDHFPGLESPGILMQVLESPGNLNLATSF